MPRRLAGSTFAAGDHRNFNRHGEAVDELKSLAPEGATLAQFALRWILMFDGVSTVIPGAKSARQVEDNSAAGELPPLSEQQMEAVRSVYDRYIRPSAHQRW